MARGKTVSITLPEKMVQSYDEKAKELNISRSKVIFNILLDVYQKEVEKKK